MRANRIEDTMYAMAEADELVVSEDSQLIVARFTNVVASSDYGDVRVEECIDEETAREVVESHREQITEHTPGEVV